MIWGLVNVLQLIANLPLLNIKFPQNAAIFFSFINEVSSFNLIPIDKIQEQVFNFSDEESEMPNNFVDMGIESRKIMKNMGTMLVYLIGFIIAVVIKLFIQI